MVKVPKPAYRPDTVVTSIRLRVTISQHDYQTAFGPATQREIREYVKATIYDAIAEGTVFPSDVPVEVEEA